MKKITSFFILLTLMSTSGFALTLKELPPVNTVDCVRGLQDLNEALGMIGELFPGAGEVFNQSASVHEALLDNLSKQSGPFALLEKEPMVETLSTLSQTEREAEVAMAIGTIAMAISQASLEELIETCRRGR